MAAKDLDRGFAPGHIRQARVLAGQAATGNDVVMTAQTAYPLFNVIAGIFVLEARARVLTAFGSSCTLDFGDGDDPNGWLATAKIVPNTAVASAPLAYKSSRVATAEAYAGGVYYATADTLDMTVGGANPATDAQIEVIIDYIPLSVIA